MSNNWHTPTPDLIPGDIARAEDVNDKITALDVAFDKLPEPHPTLKGFNEPIQVGAPTDPGHAADRNFVETGMTSQVAAAAASASAAATSASAAAASASAASSSATSASGSASSASTSATNAATSASNASTSATSAASAQTAAEAARDKAMQWATNNYNVEVETGLYSAKHWATVAQTATTSFSIVTGNTGTATADAAGDSLSIVGAGAISTVAADGPESITISVTYGNPVALGAVLAPGTADSVAHSDHVHPFPSASDVGAVSQPASVVQGDILYRGASTWERLPAGTAGKVLQTNGAAANPSWADPGGVTTAYGSVALTTGRLNVIMGANSYTIGDLTNTNIALMFERSVTPSNVSIGLINSWAVFFQSPLYSTGSDVVAPYPGTGKYGVWPSGRVRPPLLASATIGSGDDCDFWYDTLTLASGVIIAASEEVIVAFDPATNTLGTPVLFNTTGTKIKLFPTGSNSFAAIGFNTTGGGGSTIRIMGATVSGTTITLGSATQINSSESYGLPLQMDTTTFVSVYSTGASNKFAVAYTVSGTTVTLGTAVNLTGVGGAPAAKKLTSTKFLVAYQTTGGASTSTRAISARVGTVSGTTVTLGTAATSGSNTSAESINGLLEFTVGSSYAIVTSNGAANTTADFYGVSVSGDTVTLGSQQSVTTLLSGTSDRGLDAYDSYKTAGGAVVQAFSAKLIAAAISGTTLTFGSAVSVTFLSGTRIQKRIVTDLATGANYYTLESTQWSKISVSGTTITLTTVSGLAYAIYSDDMTSHHVRFSGTYYSRELFSSVTVSASFSLGAMALTSTKWISRPNSTTIEVRGPIDM